MAWFKSFEGISSDPKWPVIARKAGVNVGTVVSIWMALLDHASQNTSRGLITGFDCETIDALYGYEDGICQRVLEAFTQKGLLDGEAIANWEKSQKAENKEWGLTLYKSLACGQAGQGRKPTCIATVWQTTCRAHCLSADNPDTAQLC